MSRYSILAITAMSAALGAVCCIFAPTCPTVAQEPTKSTQPTTAEAYIPLRPLPESLQKFAGFSDEDIDQSLRKACKYLWSRQHADGKWDQFSTGDKVYAVGPTAAVCYSLMLAEGAARDDRTKKTLEWLAEQKTSKTVELMFRAGVWLETAKINPEKYAKYQEADIDMLLRADIREGFPADVLDPNSPKDSANTFFALLAMWEASMAKHDIPTKVWNDAILYWQFAQNNDYGWGKNKDDKQSTPEMTSAGIASMLICLDTLIAGKAGSYGRYRSIRPVQTGLGWMDENFADSLSDKPDYYYLFCLERAGTMAGARHIGGIDWYRAAAGQLLANQESDGSWKFADAKQGNPEIATALAVIFLSRSRQPVLFSKLQIGEDWNSRPRDLAIFSHWLSKICERTINWQTVNIKYPISEWGDAPILFISGAKSPAFTNEDLDKLRTFVQRGGVIFSCTTYEGQPFKDGMKNVYRKLFPDFLLTQQTAGDPIYNIRDAVDPSSQSPLSSRVNFSIISNGIRPFAIHCDTDLPRSWQQGPGDSDRFAFEAGANIFLYATAKGSLFNRRASICLWPDPPESPPQTTVKICRIKYKGNYDPEPLAFERFARMMYHQTGVWPEMIGDVDLKNLAKTTAQIAIMTGTREAELSDDQKAAIKQYAAAGGTIIIDAAGGSYPFAESMTKTLEGIYGPNSLARTTLFDEIYRVPHFAIQKISYRPATMARLGGKTDPQLMTVFTAANRKGIIFSREDITSGLIGYPSTSIDGYSPNSAYEIMRNLILTFGKIDTEKLNATSQSAKPPATANTQPSK